MAQYLNKATKEIIINLVGFSEYMIYLMEKDVKIVAPYHKKLKTAATYLHNITADMVKDLDMNQVRYLKNQNDHSRIALVPDSDKVLKHKQTVVPLETLSRLVNSAWGECLFCQKKGKDARECQLRADLLECGAMVHDNGKGECPFRSGML